MRPALFSVVAALLLAFGVVSCGWRAASAEEGASLAKQSSSEASAAQLKAMQRRAESLIVKSGQPSPQRIEMLPAALLRYSSPGGDVATADGSIWAWGKTGRPAALAAIFFERLPEGDKWSCELLALAEDVSVESPAGWKWTPAESALRLSPVPDAPAVAMSATARGRQMKELARRFSVSETFDENRTDQLRLMITALHRYADRDDANQERRLVDGALYAFASGTNPEALLVLEAIEDDAGRARWHFAFARLGAASCQARLKDQTVWQVPAIDAWDKSHSYYSMFGPDAAVFGAMAAAESK